MNTPEQALAFVRTHGIVTMTGRSARRSFVDAVAGGPVKGSWWGHPRGKVIFRLAEALHDSDEVLSLKLVGGKVTFVHRALWPALARVVTDENWRRKQPLSPEAKRLLRDVESLGVMRKGHRELERSLLVHSGSVHTEKGNHATVLTSWTRMFDSDVLGQSRQLTLTEALGLLGLASVP